MNYFQTFSTYSSITAISIPPQYFARDSVINVILSAQATLGIGLTTTSTQITVKTNLPTIKFQEKSQNVSGFPSDDQTIIPFDIVNTKCSNSSRLLQSSTLIPVSVDFQIYSGSSSTAITDRTDKDIQLEQNLKSLYSQYHAIPANFSLGFKYALFYKLVITVTDTTTNTKISDSLIFSFYKPPITAVIDSLGGIVSSLKDLTLNGGNSTIPMPEGDIIDYSWKCESAFSFLFGSSCSCPLLTSSNLKSKQLTIPQSRIQNLCKYTYSLTVLATSTAGLKRSNTAKTEFVAYKASILGIYGKIIKGHMPNVKDIYFSTQITSPGPDTKLSFEWNLVQVESVAPSTGTKYSQKNTFICNFLKKIGISTNIAVTNDDVAIPQNYEPDYLTSLSDRIMGLDAKKMVEKTIYTYGISVVYPSSPSFELITYEAQPQPRKRIFKITPESGVGMETTFSLDFSIQKTTDLDKAQYQILRKDCPSSNNEATPVTQVLGTRNSYAGLLSPGQESCNFQVEIILRAIEFDSSIETSAIITIKQSSKPANDVVTDSLNLMKLNYNNMSPNQKLNMLGQISNINVTERSAKGKEAVNTIMDMVTDLDKRSGGVRDLMDNNQMISLFNTTASILSNLLTTQSANVDPTIASNVTAKIANYLNDSSSISGGTNIVPSFVNTLSSVVKIGLSAASNNTFYAEIHDVVSQVLEVKIKDVMPGAIPFNTTTEKIEIVIQNSYMPTFNNTQALATGKGSEMDLPGNLANTFLNAIANTTEKANNTVTIATTMTGESFNPYVDMKTNSFLDVSSITNLSSSIFAPDTIALIYKDLAAGKLSNDVDTKKLMADIVEVAFNPLFIDKNGNNKNLDSPLGIGKLPEDKKVDWTIPGKVDPNNSIVVPMYYDDQNKVWINDGCQIAPSNKQGKVKARCNNLGKKPAINIKDINYKSVLKISTDIINDVLNVLKSGNYKMLYNFGAFTNASWSGYLVLSIIIAVLILIGYLSWFLNKHDYWLLFEERIITLEDRYGDDKEEVPEGLLMKVFSFYSQVRKKGMGNVAKSSPEGTTGDSNTVVEKEIKIPNGFNILTQYEEKKLKEMYDFYAEHATRFPNKFFFLNYYQKFCSNAILRRLTQGRINDDIIKKPVTFWRILRVKCNLKFIRKIIIM